jgi:gliding motility associated protien GldN
MRYLLFFCFACCAAPLFSQPVSTNTDTEVVVTPLDGIVERQVIAERTTLAHAPVREADILWEKRVWRVIDTREKMNLPFATPEYSLFENLVGEIRAQNITAYGVENDRFENPLSLDQVTNMLGRWDTVSIVDPATYEEQTQIIYNEINFEDVKRFRIKEIWWFDTRTSTLQQRILGIAPMINEYDNEGNFRFERPLFWVYYPHAREALASHQVYLTGDNTATRITWEDMFEMRRFSSYITKESNVQDLRLMDYLTGTDLLLEGQKIQNDIFNREHDMWTF